MQTFPSWQVLLADLRCHGQSAHMGPGMPDNSVESAAADVLELLRHLRLFPEILIGHSFGGKVIMSMADQFGRNRAAPPPASAGALHLICSFPCVILPLYHQGSDLARANPFAAYVFFQNRQAMHAAGSPCHGWCRVAACTVSPAVPSLHALCKTAGGMAGTDIGVSE